MWGVFFRRFAVPTLLLVLVWHMWIYGLIVGSELAGSAEFRYALPFTALIGVLMGYSLATLVNTRRLIFWKGFDTYGCWLPAVLIQFAVMHAVLFVWETTGTFVRPVNYIVTFLMYAALIPLWYFLTSGFSVWGYFDDNTQKISYDDKAALKFYTYWGLFHLSSTLIFTVVQWSNASIWPFWIALGVFAFHLVIWFMISLFIINSNSSPGSMHGTSGSRSRRVREKTAEYLNKVPGAGLLSGWFGVASALTDMPNNSNNNNDDIELLPTAATITTTTIAASKHTSKSTLKKDKRMKMER